MSRWSNRLSQYPACAKVAYFQSFGLRIKFLEPLCRNMLAEDNKWELKRLGTYWRQCSKMRSFFSSSLKESSFRENIFVDWTLCYLSILALWDRLLYCRRRTSKSKGSNLVDPASSHMLVSKIKPCMSKYK